MHAPRMVCLRLSLIVSDKADMIGGWLRTALWSNKWPRLAGLRWPWRMLIAQERNRLWLIELNEWHHDSSYESRPIQLRSIEMLNQSVFNVINDIPNWLWWAIACLDRVDACRFAWLILIIKLDKFHIFKAICGSYWCPIIPTITNP